VALDQCGVDLAVGCTYKYLCAGPGAPALLYVRTQLQERLRQPIWGWFGQRDQFAMGERYDPSPDVRQFLVGTPPVIGLAGVQGGVEVVAEAGLAAIRTKAVALGELGVQLHRAWLAPQGFALGSPEEGVRRGSHLALRHADAQRIHHALARDGRVITDFRFPDTIRLGLAPLTTRFSDVWDAFDRLRALSY
jgi:kynureninase